MLFDMVFDPTAGDTQQTDQCDKVISREARALR